jgi:hypothetical protein
VKPLLVANQDPKSASPAQKFVDPTTGAPIAASVIGEAVIIKPCASAACPPVVGNLQFLPAQVVAGTSNLCSGTCTPPASDYETSIDCCDSATPPANQYACGVVGPTPPNPAVNTVLVDPLLSTQTNNGLQCVTNHPSEDTLDPTELLAGTGPPKITAGSGPQLGNLVTTSRSIVTFPIIEALNVTPLRVVGFLQVFVDPVAPSPAPPNAHILNVVGCGNSPGAPPAVLGGGYSPIPVRLIH